MMNLFFCYPRTHIRLAAVLTLSLLFCNSNVQATRERLINDQQNQQIEFGNTNEVKVNMQNTIVLENNQLDLLSPILYDGKNSWALIIFLYLEGDELRQSNMVCKTFYNIIHSKNFLKFRAKMEFEKTLENYFQKFNPQIENIGPYEIKMTIQNDKIDFILDKFESKKFYFPFSLTFYKPNNDKNLQAIFIPSKNIQENYLSPFEKPERHIPFNSNLLVSAIPSRFRVVIRERDMSDDEKLVKLTYKINLENINQLFETYSKNKHIVKRRQIYIKRKLALHWIIWSGLVALDCFLWYTLGLKKTTSSVFGACFVFGLFFLSGVLSYCWWLVTHTCEKPPNNGTDNLE